METLGSSKQPLLAWLAHVFGSELSSSSWWFNQLEAGGGWPCFPKKIPYMFRNVGGWGFQPIWIFFSTISSFLPGNRLKLRNVWNHHLVFVTSPACFLGLTTFCRRIGTTTLPRAVPSPALAGLLTHDDDLRGVFKLYVGWPLPSQLYLDAVVLNLYGKQKWKLKAKHLKGS